MTISKRRPLPISSDEQTDDRGTPNEDLTVRAIEAQAQAAKEIARALNRCAQVGEKGLEKLDHTCTWLHKWGLRILWTAPFVLMAMGAITPNAAKVVSRVLSMFGF